MKPGAKAPGDFIFLNLFIILNFKSKVYKVQWWVVQLYREQGCRSACHITLCADDLVILDARLPKRRRLYDS